MIFNYIYLDDEDNKSTKAFAKVLESENTSLRIKPRYPLPFPEEIKILQKEQAKIDGLILDLRLDEFSNNGKKNAYKAQALAQELRTRATAGKFRSLPIILLSSEEKIKKYFLKDESSHNLFDLRYSKSDLPKFSKKIASELISLASGYKKIERSELSSFSSSKNLQRFLGLKDHQIAGLDMRLLNHFGSSLGKRPTHEYARLIINEILLTPGVLIDENYLAARLGIDLDKSKDWNRFKSEIASAWAYTGPFQESWPRWWMHLMNEWWLKPKNSPPSLSYLYAEERILFLKKLTRLNKFKPATPIKKNYSTKFWCVCKVLNRPLDPIDGFLIEGKSPFPWQESEYISLEAALKRKGLSSGIRVSPIETERFNNLKKSLK